MIEAGNRRWAWLKRPRWALLTGVLVLLLAYFLWPIRLYEVVGRTRGYVITLPDSGETSGGGIDVLWYPEGPWETQRRFEEIGHSDQEIRKIDDIGDGAFWLESTGGKPGEPRNLVWSRGNVGFALSAETLDGHGVGTPEWIETVERIARDTDREFLEGRAGSYEIQAHWWPRGMILIRMKYDEWLLKQGERPRGWWQDW